MKPSIIDPARYGVSFSLKQCRGFGLAPPATLGWLLQTAGFRRFRLMSYWNEHEPTPGKYDFTQLDWQLDMIVKAGGRVTLCLGARQPRWPENHWPDWAWEADKPVRSAALLAYIEQVVRRYKDHPALVSYQLENEALLKSFGRRPEVDRQRLQQEFALVKRLDPDHPLIMSTSTSWGIPLRRPIPDSVGFSYYHFYWNGSKQRYQKAGGHYAYLHRLRASLIKLMWRRPSFIHELQCEPWAPKAIWEVSQAEQNKSMGPAQLRHSLQLAQRTGLYPIDLWGGEWFYWRQLQGDESIPQIIQTLQNQE